MQSPDSSAWFNSIFHSEITLFLWFMKSLEWAACFTPFFLVQWPVISIYLFSLPASVLLLLLLPCLQEPPFFDELPLRFYCIQNPFPASSLPGEVHFMLQPCMHITIHTTENSSMSYYPSSMNEMHSCPPAPILRCLTWHWSCLCLSPLRMGSISFVFCIRCRGMVYSQ